METKRELGPYPVSIDVDVPVRFERIQLLLRVLILIAFGMIHRSGAGLFGLSFVCLPVVAAVLITRRGSAGYLEHDAPWLISVVEWVVGFYAYMLLVTDVFPLDAGSRAVRVRAVVGGQPSVPSALLRLLMSLPHFFVLVLVGCVSALLALIAALGILLRENYAEGIRSFQQGVIGWFARVLVYHASLVEQFPPLTVGRSPAPPPDQPAEHVGNV